MCEKVLLLIKYSRAVLPPQVEFYKRRRCSIHKKYGHWHRFALNLGQQTRLITNSKQIGKANGNFTMLGCMLKKVN
jgi:hypothetical protein